MTEPREKEGVTPSQCPSCKYGPMDAASHLDDPDARPSPGDLSVCLNCGEFLIFEPDLSIRRLTNDEFNAALESDPGAVEQMVAASRVIVERGPIKEEK